MLIKEKTIDSHVEKISRMFNLIWYKDAFIKDKVDKDIVLEFNWC